MAVKRIAENKDRKEQLKAMLREFKKGGSAETKEKAKATSSGRGRQRFGND